MKIHRLLACSFLGAILTPALAVGGITQFQIPKFNPLNGSGVSGSALVTLDDTNPMRPTIRVQINATGLTPDLPHPKHIHGNFTENRPWV